MITCKLNGKEYHIDFISGRAMREMGPAMEMYKRVMAAGAAAEAGKEPENAPKMEDVLDTMVGWFCMVFGRQFTPDEVYDHYPNDRLIHDIAITLLSVQSGVTEILSEFPTNPKAAGAEKA